MKRFAILLATSATLAAPAFAGGMNTPVAEPVVPAVEPAPVPVNTAGEWGGFYAGANLGYGKATAKDAGTTIVDGKGAVGGVQAGYRWDLGQTVLGLEGAYDIGNMKDGANGKVKNQFDLKAQLGYDMGSSLAYVTAGASRAKADIAGTTGTDNGWVAGVGYEYALNDQLSLGAEYLRHEYKNFANTGAKLKDDTLALRVNFRF